MFLSTVLPGGKRLYLPLLQQRRAGSVDGWGQRRAEANLRWNPPRRQQQRATGKGLWQTTQ